MTFSMHTREGNSSIVQSTHGPNCSLALHVSRSNKRVRILIGIYICTKIICLNSILLCCLHVLPRPECPHSHVVLADTTYRDVRVGTVCCLDYMANRLSLLPNLPKFIWKSKIENMVLNGTVILSFARQKWNNKNVCSVTWNDDHSIKCLSWIGQTVVVI